MQVDSTFKKYPRTLNSHRWVEMVHSYVHSKLLISLGADLEYDTAMIDVYSSRGDYRNEMITRAKVEEQIRIIINVLNESN